MISRFVFQPPGPLPSVFLIRSRKDMSVVIEPDAKIYYIHFKNPLANRSISQNEPLIILYNHGNAEDLGTCYDKLACLSYAIGIDIIAYDYCGYGFSRANSQRKPTEERVYEDADAMFTELTIKLQIPPHRIIIMGRSMGGGPACYLANKHHNSIGGLILLSTFTSCLGAVSCSFLRYCCCFLDMFPNDKFLKNVDSCPVLIMHGKKDNLVSFSCAKKILKIVEKAQRKNNIEMMIDYHWFKLCKHNEIETQFVKELADVIKLFLNRVVSYNSKRSDL